jgi:hypothetical protein
MLLPKLQLIYPIVITKHQPWLFDIFSFESGSPDVTMPIHAYDAASAPGCSDELDDWFIE